jgi:hypothetical protein
MGGHHLIIGGELFLLPTCFRYIEGREKKSPGTVWIPKDQCVGSPVLTVLVVLGGGRSFKGLGLVRRDYINNGSALQRI